MGIREDLEKYSREQLMQFCIDNDSNGEYSDEDSEALGEPPLDKEYFVDTIERWIEEEEYNSVEDWLDALYNKEKGKVFEDYKFEDYLKKARALNEDAVDDSRVINLEIDNKQQVDGTFDYNGQKQVVKLMPFGDFAQKYPEFAKALIAKYKAQGHDVKDFQALTPDPDFKKDPNTKGQTVITPDNK